MSSTWTSNPCLSFARKLLKFCAGPCLSARNKATHLKNSFRGPRENLGLKCRCHPLVVNFELCRYVGIHQILHVFLKLRLISVLFFQGVWVWSWPSSRAAVATEICCWAMTIPTKASFNFSRVESPAPFPTRFLLGSRCTCIFPLSSPASSCSSKASCFLFYDIPDRFRLRGSGRNAELHFSS